MTYSKFDAFDAAPGLLKRDAAQAALTASGWVGPQWDQGGAASTDAILIANVESVAAGGNQTYTFRVIGSNQANRSDGEVLAMGELGAASALAQETRGAAVGDRLELPFRTEKGDRKFRYVDLHMTVGGTGPSIGFNAHITKEV